MSVRIRLSRIGAHKKPFFRVVAVTREQSRDGGCLELLGFYDPKKEKEKLKLNKERYQYWLQKGALPTTIISNLVKRENSCNKGG